MLTVAMLFQDATVRKIYSYLTGSVSKSWIIFLTTSAISFISVNLKGTFLILLVSYQQNIHK